MQESLQPNNLAKEKEVDDTDYGALLKEFENDTEALEMISIVVCYSLTLFN